MNKGILADFFQLVVIDDEGVSEMLKRSSSGSVESGSSLEVNSVLNI